MMARHNRCASGKATTSQHHSRPPGPEQVRPTSTASCGRRTRARTPQRPICGVRARVCGPHDAVDVRRTGSGPGGREGCCDVVALPEAQLLCRAVIIDQWERRQLRPVGIVEQLVHDVRSRRGDEYESFQHFCSMLPMLLLGLPLSFVCMRRRGFWGGTYSKRSGMDRSTIL